MRLTLAILAAIAWDSTVVAFVPSLQVHGAVRTADLATSFARESLRSLRVATSDAATEDNVTTDPPRKTLGLLTFDLDDTLFPIAPVLEEANAAFSRAMDSFGYVGIDPKDIDETSKRIRAEMAKSDEPLSHTEVRLKAIRIEMEKFIVDKKLKETALDWATDVADLNPLVVKSAKSWSTTAVHSSVVQAVYNAWEMERHHAAERHLYPEVVDVFRQLKEDHPGVVIGAVTDGKANPLVMVHTLAPFFDFCMSWEDHQMARRKFFKELGLSESNADLRWIYDAAYEKYKELAIGKAALVAAAEADAAAQGKPGSGKHFTPSACWIHVGDDLAYDVGGSATCGAKTIWVDLADDYGQTAKKRLEGGESMRPSWHTATSGEMERRRVMAETAKEKVDERIIRLSELPRAINKILDKAD